MNAVERLVVYTELPSEEQVMLEPVKDLSMSWPSQGAIAFKDVDLVYREGLPTVLKGVSFSVKPGEKVCHSEYAVQRKKLICLRILGGDSRKNWLW
jgi:ATP-binding cassette, subfamily C (CFTR/MRP), member 1